MPGTGTGTGTCTGVDFGMRSARSPVARATPSASAFPQWWTVAALAFVTLTAVLTCLHGLGARSLWLDEIATVAITRQHGPALLDAIRADGGNMVLYYLVIHVLGLYGSSPTLLRLPSALASIATVPVAFFVAARLFGRRVALFSAVLLALNVSLVFYAQDARGYSLALLLGTASWSALWAATRPGARRAPWVLYGALAVASVYAHLLGGLYVFAQAVWIVWDPGARRSLRRALVVAGVGGVALLPAVGTALAQGAGQISWIPPLNLREMANTVAFLGGGSGFTILTHGFGSVVQSAEVGAWALGVLVLMRVIRQGRRVPKAHPGGPKTPMACTDSAGAAQRALASWLIVPLVAGVVVSLRVPILEPRYFIESLPAATMLAGLGLARALSPAMSVAGLALLVGLSAVQVVRLEGVSQQDWRTAASIVLQPPVPHTAIVFDSPGGRTAFSYYRHRAGLISSQLPTPLLPADPWGSRKFYVHANDALTAAQTKHLSRYDRVWLVLSYPDTALSATASYKRVRAQLHGCGLKRQWALQGLTVQALTCSGPPAAAG